MRILRNITAPALITLACLNSGHAGTTELGQAIFDASPKNVEVASREQRDKQADAILAYWKNVSERIPKLSPQEDEWLQGELAASNDRIMRAFRSREFAVSESGRIAEDCVKAAQALIDSRDRYLDEPNLETFFWLDVTYCYTQSDDLRINLKNAGLSNGEWDGSFNVGYNSLILRNILKVTIPSSLADAEGWSLSMD